MNHNDLYYVPGQWWIICDVCSIKTKSAQAKQRWDGLICCPTCWEMRQPQDFVKARADKITVPFTRPRPTDLFEHVCSLLTSSGVADVGTADCAMADNDQYWTQYEHDATYENANWGKSYCSPQTRTGIAGLGTAGCCIAAYNIDAY